MPHINSTVKAIIKLCLTSYVLLQTTTVIGLNLNDMDDKIMYSLGSMTAENLKAQEENLITAVKPGVFIEGFNDTLADKKQLTQEQMTEALKYFQEKQQLMHNNTKTSQLNLQTGQEFLAQNKKNKNIKVLKNGLQYQIVKSGNKLAKSPTINDKVQVQYRGTLLNGTEFDSTYKHSTPTIFELKSLIPGWQEALVLMKPNAKWKLFVPPQLAYGTRGAAPIIGPNEVLVFEIELIAVNPA
jgi:FKBP-type peptidyl-prolyl cis-trans isomerase FklB